MPHVTTHPKTGLPYSTVVVHNSRHIVTVQTGRRVWADCPKCGPVEPHIEQPTTSKFVAHAKCSKCQSPATLRLIEISTPRGKAPKTCSAACLSGKKVCDCQCQGRCHGADVCRCGTPHRPV